jgi:hypothetical protein
VVGEEEVEGDGRAASLSPARCACACRLLCFGLFSSSHAPVAHRKGLGLGEAFLRAAHRRGRIRLRLKIGPGTP